jgi:HSP20 family protein
MNLIRWNPGTGLNPIDFDRIFDNFLESTRFPSRKDSSWMPRVDVNESEDKFEVTAELPGMKKKDIDIGLQENRLTIKGQKETMEEKDNNKYYIRERVSGKFERSFTLPENVDKEKIEAKFNDGVLTLEIPKTELPEEKEVKIKVK